MRRAVLEKKHACNSFFHRSLPTYSPVAYSRIVGSDTLNPKLPKPLPGPPEALPP